MGWSRAAIIVLMSPVKWVWLGGKQERLRISYVSVDPKLLERPRQAVNSSQAALIYVWTSSTMKAP